MLNRVNAIGIQRVPKLLKSGYSKMTPQYCLGVTVKCFWGQNRLKLVKRIGIENLAQYKKYI